MKKVKMIDIRPVIKGRANGSANENFSFFRFSTVLILIFSLLLMPYSGQLLAIEDIAIKNSTDSKDSKEVIKIQNNNKLFDLDRENIVLKDAVKIVEIKKDTEAKSTDEVIRDVNDNESDNEGCDSSAPDAEMHNIIPAPSVKITNHSPLGVTDEYKIYSNKKLKENVLKNDTDIDGDKLTSVYISPINSKSVFCLNSILASAEVNSECSTGETEGAKFPIELRFGTLKEFNNDGTFLYIPNENYSGRDEFVYKVYDGNSYSEETKVYIDVIEYVAPNNKPVANAGSNQIVDEGTLVTLDASASSDTDMDPLTYSWTAPDGIVLSNSNAVNPSFTAPQVSVNTDYTFTLIVNDSKENSDPSTVVITVNDISVPGGGGGIIHTCNPSSVNNGSVSSYPFCVITCNAGYVLNDNQCILSEDQNNNQGDDSVNGSNNKVNNEEGKVLGDKIWAKHFKKYEDQLLRCEDHKVFAIRDNVRIYIPDLKTLREKYLGQDINYASCEDIAKIPSVLGDNTRKQCVADRKFKNGELIRGSNMKIFVIVDGHKVYIPSLEDLLHKHFGKEIFNVCDSVLELY